MIENKIIISLMKPVTKTQNCKKKKTNYTMYILNVYLSMCIKSQYTTILYKALLHTFGN